MVQCRLMTNQVNEKEGIVQKLGDKNSFLSYINAVIRSCELLGRTLIVNNEADWGRLFFLAKEAAILDGIL